MAELLERLKHEKALEQLLKRMSQKHAQALAKYLETAKSIDDIPKEFWDSVRKDIEDRDGELATLLALMFEESAVQHAKSIAKHHGINLSVASIHAAAMKHTAKRLKQIAPGYVRWSKEVAQKGLNEVGHVSDEEVKERKKSSKRVADTVFNPARAKRMSDTEANVSMIDGGEYAVKKSKINVIRFWAHSRIRPKRHSNADVKPCAICSPMEGKAESDWNGLMPGKSHPNCDCGILYVDEYGNTIGDDDNQSDTFERFKHRLPPGFLKPREDLYRDHDVLESEHDVSGEARDSHGRWTAGGDSGASSHPLDKRREELANADLGKMSASDMYSLMDGIRKDVRQAPDPEWYRYQFINVGRAHNRGYDRLENAIMHATHEMRLNREIADHLRNINPVLSNQFAGAYEQRARDAGELNRQIELADKAKSVAANDLSQADEYGQKAKELREQGRTADADNYESTAKALRNHSAELNHSVQYGHTISEGRLASPKLPLPAGTRTLPSVPSNLRISNNEGTSHRIKELFGADWNEGHIAGLIGAPDGSNIGVYDTSEGGLSIAVTKNQDDPRKTPIIDATRTIKKGPNGELICNNDVFVVAKSHRGSGVGGAMLASQIDNLKAAGISRLDTLAARGSQYVGYKVWPRMGYDAVLDNDILDRISHSRLPAAAKSSKTIQELYQHPEGVAWWEKNGDTIALSINFADPTSLSSTKADAYAKKVKAKMLAASVKESVDTEEFLAPDNVFSMDQLELLDEINSHFMTKERNGSGLPS